MKIVQINSVCGTGSTGKIAVDIYNLCKESDIDCCIAFGRGEAPANVKNIKIENQLSCSMHGLQTRFFDRHGLGSKHSTKRFVKRLLEEQVDIIHLHNIHGYYLHYPTLFKYLKDTNISVVWTLHDCWTFTGHCAYFSYIECEKWKVGCHNCPNKKNYPSSLIIDKSAQNYLLKKKYFSSLSNVSIITPSDWLAGLVRESFLSKYKIYTINNGIDVDTYKKTLKKLGKIKNNNERIVILGLAFKMDFRKGKKEFIELAEKLDIHNYELKLVGVEEGEKKDYPDHVTTIPRTNNLEELISLYYHADVLFNPTLEENYPTVNLEAQACGLPVVTYDTGGCKETIVNDNCFVIKPSVNEFLALLKSTNFIKKNLSEIPYDKLDKYYQLNKYIMLYRDIFKARHSDVIGGL